jgi:hypothetical protein
MKPSTRKGLLLLGLVLVLLSFEFLATSAEFYMGHPKHSSTTNQMLEYAGAVTVFIGVIMFAASSLTLAFSLDPKGTIKFGAILVLSFITSFTVARPYFGHS